MTARLHHHGVDCCWACFEGRDTHPTDPDDYTCEREREVFRSTAECDRVAG